MGGGAAATILWGCGGGRGRVQAPRVDADDGVRHWVRDAVARLGGAFVEASALAAMRTHTVATADAGGRAIRSERAQSLVLSARDAAGRRFERVTADRSPSGLSVASHAGDADIAAAAARALELMTPGAAPDGDFGVVLDPSVAAAIAEAGVADVMTADAWRRADLGARGAWKASEALTIAD